MVVPRNPKSYRPPSVKSRSRFYLGFFAILFSFAAYVNNEDPPYVFVTVTGLLGIILFFSAISLPPNEYESKVIH